MKILGHSLKIGHDPFLQYPPPPPFTYITVATFDAIHTVFRVEKASLDETITD
jgi:hypothetical protein